MVDSKAFFGELVHEKLNQAPCIERERIVSMLPEGLDLTCPICSGGAICKDPFWCPNEHIFGRECLSLFYSQHKRKPPTCPVCRVTMDIQETESHPIIGRPCPRFLRNMVNALVLRCQWSNQGCEHTCALEAMDKHEREECLFRPLYCPFKSKGCEEQCEARNMSQHAYSCTYRPRGDCSNITRGCQVKDLYLDELENHERECEFRLVECQKGCGSFVPFLGTSQDHNCISILKRKLDDMTNELQLQKQKCASMEREMKTIVDNREQFQQELETKMIRIVQSRFESLTNDMQDIRQMSLRVIFFFLFFLLK